MSARPIIAVRHYCPGGREHGGGIGRLVGYVVDAAAREGVSHAVFDTRGKRWTALSVLRLAAAMGLMVWDRATAPERLQHIHVAGRGSTGRKLLLCGLARTLGAPHLLHLHDYDYAADYRSRPDWAKRAIGHMFRAADHVIVLGQRDRALVAELLGVDPARLSVLHNCVPDPGPIPRPRPNASEPTILFLGRLSDRKGLPELLEALASPELAGLSWHAVLAGDGPVASYRQQADVLDLQGRVTMPGWLNEAETQELCARAAILVLPSHAEGLAMAVVEGLAHGIPVVTTRVGAHAEVITDGETGLFVPVSDPDALAAALGRLLRNPALRRRIGLRARALFVARLGMGPYLRRLEAIYGTARGRGLKPSALPERSGS